MPDQNLPQMFTPERPDWEFWRQRGACRIWKAVMLSMNIEPTRASREEVRDRAPGLYEEYIRRREIAVVQYNVHPLLPRLDHVRAGRGQFDQYVLLSKMLEFAKDIRWRDVAAFENGLTGSSLDSENSHLAEVEFDDLPKGERYTIVRMGALLSILQKSLLSKEIGMKTKFIRSESLNFAAIGREMEDVIALAATKQKKEAISCFKEDSNRKQVAAAFKALNEFF